MEALWGDLKEEAGAVGASHLPCTEVQSCRWARVGDWKRKGREKEKGVCGSRGESTQGLG